MADFLSSSLCRGRRVRLVQALRIKSRPHLVARLMQQRTVPRFIVAPAGFGKTHLALEYAQTVFNLEHVSWIDGKSPCFLRDLDSRRLASRLAELDPALALVVFDDLPRLSGPRADEFSRVVDALLRLSAEVLVCTTPSADAYSRRQIDRMRLGHDQLLLTARDAEWTASSHKLPAHGRIPALAWGEESAADGLVQAMASEDLPDPVTLALFALLAVGSGRVEDVRYRIPALSTDALRVLQREYLAAGLSADCDSFDAVQVSVEAVNRAFAPRLDALAAHARLQGRAELVDAVAQVLLDAGRAQRACGLVRVMTGKRFAAQWLRLHAGQLCALELMASAFLLQDAAAASKGTEAHKDAVAQAWRLHVLGLDQVAAKRLDALLRRFSLAPQVRGWALCLAVLCSTPQRAVELAVQLDGFAGKNAGAAQGAGAGEDADQTSVPGPLPGVQVGWGDWPLLAQALCNLVCRGAVPEAEWARVEQLDLDQAPKDLLAAVLVGQGSAQAAACARLRLEQLEGRAAFSPHVALACAAVGALKSADPNVRATALTMNGPAMQLLLWAEEELTDQSWQVMRALDAAAAEAAKRPERAKEAQCGATQAGEEQPAYVPQLRIRLMGGLMVHQGGRDVSGEFLRRRKVGGLLCLLALNAGVEVTRERILQALWPGKDTVVSMKNLYSVWSSLRVLLRVGKSSPYLERTQGGYRLDPAHVEVDVSRLRDLLRTLRLEAPEPVAWKSLLADFDDLVGGPLLPSELSSSQILGERQQLAQRMADALTASAEKLFAQGHAELAREFAQRALAHGVEREEIYYLNMRCLLACGQREEAIALYFRNRTFLAESLGIDPSAKVIDLYRSILEDEEPF